MLQMAIKVEQQLKRQGVGRTNPVENSSATWRSSTVKRDEGKAVTKPQNEIRRETSKPILPGKTETPLNRTRDVKCFRCQGLGHISSQCPNKRVMIVNARGEIESKSEEDVEEEELLEPEEGFEVVIGEALVTRRILSVQSVEEEKSQRENLFHTRCFVNGKVCNLIIDGGSCTNVARSEMVEKLGMLTLRHPQPYRLQWLDDCADVKVTKQVLVSFSIREYVDEVLCDVVPMQACHIVLGRPWQFDRKVTHDGFTNKLSFVLRKQKVVLIPLSPKQVLEDQKKKKEKMRAEKKRKKRVTWPWKKEKRKKR